MYIRNEDGEYIATAPVTRSGTENETTYCPGCGHGISHRLMAEVIHELGIREQVIGVSSIGCSAFIPRYVDVDFVVPCHGRSPSVATGIKRVLPDRIVFTYQGDGDALAIGMAETMHAALRAENILMIIENNANYGMTGGQVAPTTLIGQVTTTTMHGRTVEEFGYPIHLMETLAPFEGVSYAARAAMNSPKNIIRCKNILKRAFLHQKQHKGLALVELLGACPEGWRQTPSEAVQWMDDKMVPANPLGEYKTPEGGYRPPVPDRLPEPVGSKGI